MYVVAAATVVVSLCLSCVNNVEASFIAAIVEYHPIQESDLKPFELLQRNTNNYIELLQQVYSKVPNVDLIVYPEGTLTYSHNYNEYVIADYASAVVHGDTPCDASSGYYPDFIHDLSCAARNYTTFIVVNLIEQAECHDDDTNSTNCLNYGSYFYNTDVIFDTTGTIVGRYRKYNLFGEYALDRPSKAELITFAIRDRVFGVFTCFDILFQHPALDLVDTGVNHFVFPTMWFAELPFLTAIQTQQMWAQGNSVNLYASNANNPSLGSGGSGIYKSVTDDILLPFSIIVEDGGSEFLWTESMTKTKSASISNNVQLRQVEAKDTTKDIDELAKNMDNFYLSSENLENYTSILLNFTDNTNQYEQVCSTSSPENFCCDFTFNVAVQEENVDINDDRQYYVYRLIAFDGNRSHTYATAHLQVCALIACRNESIASCGHRFGNYDDVEWPWTFNELIIAANFTNSPNHVQYPNSLLSSIRPIDPTYTNWTREEHPDANQVERVYGIKEPQNRLFTFAIYGRKYE